MRALKAAWPFLPVALFALLLVHRMEPVTQWPGTHEFFRSNQGYRYPYLLDMFKASFLAGHAYPRWLPDIAGGYGLPTFLFYGAGFWFLALPFALLLGTLPAIYLTLFLLLALGGGGAYLLARLYAHKPAALACALLFLCVPYLFELLYGRGRFGEVSAMMAAPWAWYCFLLLHRRLLARMRFLAPALGFCLACAAVIYAHPFAAFWLAVTLALAAASLLPETPRAYRPRWLALLLCCVPIILALASPYLVPLWQMQHAVTTGGAVFASPLEPSPSMREVITQKTGWIAYLAMALGLWAGRRSPFAWAMTLFFFAATYLQTTSGTWLWRRLEFLHYTQSFSRANGMLLPLYVLAAARAFALLPEKLRLLPPFLCAALGIYGIAQTVQATANLTRFDYPSFAAKTLRDGGDMTHTGEFYPRTAKRNLPGRFRDRLPLAELEQKQGELTLQEEALPHRIRAQALVSPPASLLIRQWYLPGWRVTVNNIALEPDSLDRAEIAGAVLRLTPQGLMRVIFLREGSYAVDAYYDGPPRALARNLAALLTLLAGLLMLLFLQRRTDRHD